MAASDSRPIISGRVAAWERRADLPLLVAALASVPLLVAEEAASGAVGWVASIANWAIWGLFVVDLAARAWLVRSGRARYLVKHWYDVVIVVLSVLPYFRPLRVLRSARALRVLRAARVVAYSSHVWHAALHLWGKLTGRVLIALVPVIVAAGSAGVWMVERDSNSNIDHYGDAAWWAITTVTTVGYGDIAPVTAEGRAIAAVLMITGIAAFGVVTANVAAAMTTRRDSNRDIDTRIDELLATVNELKQHQAPQA